MQALPTAHTSPAIYAAHEPDSKHRTMAAILTFWQPPRCRSHGTDHETITGSGAGFAQEPEKRIVKTQSSGPRQMCPRNSAIAPARARSFFSHGRTCASETYPAVEQIFLSRSIQRARLPRT